MTHVIPFTQLSIWYTRCFYQKLCDQEKTLAWQEEISWLQTPPLIQLPRDRSLGMLSSHMCGRSTCTSGEKHTQGSIPWQLDEMWGSQPSRTSKKEELESSLLTRAKKEELASWQEQNKIKLDVTYLAHFGHETTSNHRAQAKSSCSQNQWNM